MAMTEFYVKNDTHWVKVTRLINDKTFIFALGWTGCVDAFRITKATKQYISTIKEAKEFAQYMLENV